MDLAEIEAAIAKAEAAGRTDLADKLRPYADKLRAAQPAPVANADPVAIDAAIAKAEAAGRMDLADKLRAYLPAAPAPAAPAPVAPAPAAIDGPVPPPAPETSEDIIARQLAEFEAANPTLAGKYSAANLPEWGDVVGRDGGPVVGGFGGSNAYTVKPWRAADLRQSQDSFGETAGAMMEGPIAGMKAFGGGLTGGPSPTRDYIANDPLLGMMPGWMQTGLGGVGDAGGAAMSAVGAGLSGLVGLGVEAVPGQNSAAEKKLADDLMIMSMLAVPELAGVSSIAAAAPAVAGRAAKVAEAAAKVAPKAAPVVEAADAAKRLGIPVMRTDVKPPSTFIGKVIQKTGEAIPLAGTGTSRARQQSERISAAQRFAKEYGADNIVPAIDDVSAGLLEKRSADLKKYTGQKKEVISSLSDKGVVPVPKAVAAIDAQIARLQKQNMASLDPVIAKLEELKASIKDQKLTEIEANRAVIGEAFSGMDMGAIRSVGEKALSAVYGPLRDDMASFIKSVGGQTALNKWGSANAKLSEMAGQLGNSTLKRALSKGEASPEVVRSMLFSAKPSDVKLLYGNLNEKGKASARTAIVQEALAKSGGIDDISPDRFKQSLGKQASQIGVFFKGDDFAAADGLFRALKLTERAAVAGVAPLTGVQNLPAAVGILVSSFFGGSLPATAAALGGIGGLARIYEATGVRSALKSLAKAETPKAKSGAIQALNQALIDAGIPVGNMAGQAANTPGPDIEALWGRY